jgi:hypothetical protein
MCDQREFNDILLRIEREVEVKPISQVEKGLWNGDVFYLRHLIDPIPGIFLFLVIWIPPRLEP